MICAAVERCAGIDVGKTFLAVCRMSGPLEGEARVEKQRFGTIRSELEKLRDWLKGRHHACGDGEHRILLEAGVQRFGRERQGLSGQPAGGEDAEGSQRKIVMVEPKLDSSIALVVKPKRRYRLDSPQTFRQVQHKE